MTYDYLDDIEELEKDADKMIEEMNKRTKEKNG